MPKRRVKELERFRKLLVKGIYPPIAVRDTGNDSKGLGVFALNQIKPFTIISEYIGDVMTTYDIEK